MSTGDRRFRTLVYALARALTGEFNELMAAADVVAGSFRAEAEAKWKVAPRSSRRALRTLAEIGYAPEDRWILEAIAQRFNPTAAGSCSVCGAKLEAGEGVRHAFEAHRDALAVYAKQLAEELGIESPPVEEIQALLTPRGAWWYTKTGASKLQALVPLATQAAIQQLSVQRGTAARLVVDKVTDALEQMIPKIRRPSRVVLAAAVKKAISQLEEVEVNGVKWKRVEWDGRRALYSLKSGG